MCGCKQSEWQPPYEILRSADFVGSNKEHRLCEDADDEIIVSQREERQRLGEGMERKWSQSEKNLIMSIERKKKRQPKWREVVSEVDAPHVIEQSFSRILFVSRGRDDRRGSEDDDCRRDAARILPKRR